MDVCENTSKMSSNRNEVDDCKSERDKTVQKSSLIYKRTHIARERERAKNACKPRHIALFLFNFSVRKFFAIDTFPSSKERYFFDIALRAEILYR